MPPAPEASQILVVDDEFVIRRLTQTILESAGFRVLTANDGEEALSLYRERQQDIDLIVLDLALPGLSGEEVLAALLRLNADIRVVVCSAHVCGDDENLLQQGARAVIPKPFRVERLLSSVEQALAPAVK